MKIYTRTGDEGETGLFGGQRVGKTHLRVVAYGDVDELNSHLGRAETLLRDLGLTDVLREIQRDLFALGADLATPPGANAGAAARAVRLDPARIARLEELIDAYEAENEPLKTFILPGGSPGAADLHVCRTVCRRAERAVIALTSREEVGNPVPVYLNRLSDLLFVMARWVNRNLKVAEPPWPGAD